MEESVHTVLSCGVHRNKILLPTNGLCGSPRLTLTLWVSKTEILYPANETLISALMRQSLAAG